ncbi:MAG: hypothetical protein ACRDIZ_09470 [Actinomycetota bacterium]
MRRDPEPRARLREGRRRAHDDAMAMERWARRDGCHSGTTV